MANKKTLDTSLHGRRRTQRMRDPEYRIAYEQTARELEQTDQMIRTLDGLRIDLGMSKAELARRINRNASSIRRLFTAKQARPELTLVAAIAAALGAEVRLVPRSPEAKRAVRERTGTERELVASADAVGTKKYARHRGSARRETRPVAVGANS